MTVLFVGMTAPKQEKWVFQNRERIPADIVCSIGAVFDFYAGTGKRPPAWMVRSKLEWLGRLISSPKKIWKRVFLSGPRFFISVLKLK
jgi:N-acetylglucosaminyldiphosphoundecaprenol N-acetyl-beta-D-mannosaminyltransferase